MREDLSPGEPSALPSEPVAGSTLQAPGDADAATGSAPDAALGFADDDWWTSAKAFAELGGELARENDASGALERLAALVPRRIPAATAASVTMLRRGEFTTEASTDERATAADAIQYELGTGPCVDAILDDAIYRPEDLRHDDRWPEFGARVASECGFHSMLSFRLQVEDFIAGLNIYAESTHAFDEQDTHTGVLLATHAGIALSAANQRARADNLERALQTSREIGAATGILMTRYLIGYEQAFDLLRIASQRHNRKLNQLAAEVISTGTLPDPAGRSNGKK